MNSCYSEVCKTLTDQQYAYKKLLVYCAKIRQKEGKMEGNRNGAKSLVSNN